MVTEEDELLAVKAAVLYYEDDKTQDEVGALLNLTRWKVGRLLAQAKEKGFVKIEIVHPRARRLTLERALETQFGLVDAVVVPRASGSTAEENQKRVADAAAEYLSALRPVPRVLGVSWGRTLGDVAQSLKPDWATGVNVVQINGGVSLNRRASPAADTAAAIARKAKGSAILLPSPAILERVSTKLAIESDRTVARVLDLGRSASAYLFSAGLAEEHSVLVGTGYLSVAEIRELVEKGAVGDVVGRFVDANGNVVDALLDDRTVGISLDDLRSAKIAIAVIAGKAKRDICRTVVSSQLCTVLVTDEEVAEFILGDVR